MIAPMTTDDPAALATAVRSLARHVYLVLNDQPDDAAAVAALARRAAGLRAANPRSDVGRLLNDWLGAVQARLEAHRPEGQPRPGSAAVVGPSATVVRPS